MKLSIEEPTGEPYVPMVYDITPNQWVYQIESEVFTIWGEDRDGGYLVTGVYANYYDRSQNMVMMQYLFGTDGGDYFLWEDQSEAIHEAAAALVEWMMQRDGVDAEIIAQTCGK